MPAISRMRSLFVLPIMLTAILSAMFVATTPKASAVTTSQRIGTAVGVALNQVGDPYRYGAAGPNAFDCSGLVYFSYRKAGFSRIPRTSSAQANFARHIRKANMRRGDLMFFTSGGHVYHVGIFLGRARDGRPLLLHAPRSGERVHRERVWTNQWFPGTLRYR